MTAATFDLTAKRHESRVLGQWMAAGGARQQRPQALGENGVQTNLTAEQLMSVLGLVGQSASGINVTAEAAMRVSTVYACVSLLAGAIASLPFAVFERDGNTRKRAEGHEYWWMLNEQACDSMTSATAWECLLANRFFHGDGIARLLRPGYGSSRVIGWEPLPTLRVQPFCAPGEPERIYYRYQPSQGAQVILDQADVIHLPSLGFDGLTSPSPITYAAREAIGTALAAENYSARFFADGATFDYALKTAQNLKKDQLEDLRTSLMARSQGSRSPLILSGGLEPAQLSINPRDAEILATRLFSVEEICRIFGVPPHMVGHTEKTTSWGSGIEAQGAGFVRYTLQRHLTPLAQEWNRKLWPTRARYFVEHVTAALERGDLKGRYEAYRIALGRAGEQPFMNIDEVRRLENMAPDPTLQRNQGSSSNAQPTDPAAQ